MPILKLDRGADKQLNRLDKKHHDMRDRFDKTKNAFDSNHSDPKLDFKRYRTQAGIFKIKLLGKHDGRRLLLKPDKDSDIFYVFDILEHDDQ